MTDLDQRISDILRERAEGPVDPGGLTARAVAVGRRRRRRRRAVAGSGLAVLALLGGLAVGPGLPGVGRPFTAAGPAVPAVVPALVRDAPGAAAAPETIGTDPGMLHFGVDPAKVRYLGWGVGGGVETVQLDAGDGRTVTVDLASSSATLRGYGVELLPVSVGELATEAAFDGRTIRLTAEGRPIQVRHWRPAPGVYARAVVPADTDAGLTVAAQALRLDEARRCGGPVRLTRLPDGAGLSSCQVDASRFPKLVTVNVNVTRPGDRWMRLSYRYAVEAGGAPRAGNTEIDGRPAYLVPGPAASPVDGDPQRTGGELELLGLAKTRLEANWGWPTYGFDERDARVLLGGARVADPTRPESWD
ncbi:hypothetical protein K7640_16180 [Micromonospora sp. PLK6-60]|uniref:hypothetical protein n=1 Tax=Micromonospora sp. PLK6-60 TaxID=2873383 RepID=UPI001CA6FC25|nr:hypothetical protein [Micromonospora sp. PLK6-60]MBY8873373.1 hypothetical protein [Micromonospora sp. PLK6-60]